MKLSRRQQKLRNKWVKNQIIKIKGKIRYSSTYSIRGNYIGWSFEKIKGTCGICKRTKKFDFLKYLGKDQEICICPECIIEVGEIFLEAYNSL